MEPGVYTAHPPLALVVFVLLMRTDGDKLAARERGFFVQDSELHKKAGLTAISCAKPVIDMIDTMRDYLAGSLDIYTTQQTQRINQSMQRLTAISLIFLPLTFITGIYGMNFIFMPETQWHYGFYAIVALCAVVGGGCCITSTARGCAKPPFHALHSLWQRLYLYRGRGRDKGIQGPRQGGWGAAATARPAADTSEGLRLPHRGEGIVVAGVRGALSLFGWRASGRHRARRHLGHPRRAPRARGSHPCGHRDARRHLRGDGQQALDLHPDRPLQLQPAPRRARRERTCRRRPLARLWRLPRFPGTNPVRYPRRQDGALGRRLHRHIDGRRDHRGRATAWDHGPRRPPLGRPRLGYGQHRGADADRGRRHTHASSSGTRDPSYRHPDLLHSPRRRTG